MKNISEHISYEEGTHSDAAIRLHLDNTPPPDILIKMQEVAEACFEPIRKQFGPVHVNSFYRSDAVNKAVGGATKNGVSVSQHCKGLAIDLSGLNGVTNKQIYDWAKANLVYDQLIWEYGNETNPAWVHISFNKGANRNMQLTIK